MKLTTTLILSLLSTIIYSQETQADLIARARTLGVKVTRTLPKVEKNEEESNLVLEEEMVSENENFNNTALELSNDLSMGVDLEEVESESIDKEITANEEVSTIKEFSGKKVSFVEAAADEIFTVQIAASKTPLNETFFGYTPEFHFKNEDGFYRYYSVVFPTFEEAQEYAETLRAETKFKEAFVVKVKNGTKTASYFGQ